ncbi:Udp-glycosyltransferase 79b2 [Thalictrum thalictroides]|uniref:Glycosyltransferase n=1 Tax=Thalictrum thalictroides TaxID=46969 RepID=A0A7J6V416_THATH|nr:Udp-glycosyltransferase 79b2 [Thalictrum thalictroides]
MFPWFAMGHITPFLHLSNKLAEKGHKVTFLIPSNTQNKFNHLNHHPHLIQFIPLAVPQVDGLPLGAETMSDIPVHQAPVLAVAFDLTKDQVKIALENLKPNLIFFDFAYWLPPLAESLGVKCIFFSVCSAVSTSYILVPARKLYKGQHFSEHDLIEPPKGYPSGSSMKHLLFEAKDGVYFSSEFNGGISFFHRLTTSMTESQALCYRACTEMEGPFIDYFEKQYNKEILLTGPILPKPSHTPLEERWAKWLDGFKQESVVYCAFGSECVMEKDQFQELVLGLEQTGLPFLVRLKPPFGCETLEEALPEGFEERVKGRGVVHGDWIQQQQILSHASVGCFVSHCGFGSMWESLVSSCQIVLVPQAGDQHANAKFMTKELKVAMDVERREEDGWFTKESVCKAVKLVMDEGSEVGEQVRANHLKWKDFLLTEDLETSYINNFMIKLHDILK